MRRPGLADGKPSHDGLVEEAETALPGLDRLSHTALGADWRIFACAVIEAGVQRKPFLARRWRAVYHQYGTRRKYASAMCPVLRIRKEGQSETQGSTDVHVPLHTGLSSPVNPTSRWTVADRHLYEVAWRAYGPAYLSLI